MEGNEMRKIYVPLALLLCMMGNLYAQDEIKLPEATHGPKSICQRDDASGIELQCLPILNETMNITGFYVFYINASENDYMLAAPSHRPLGFSILVSEKTSDNQEGGAPVQIKTSDGACRSSENTLSIYAKSWPNLRRPCYA